MQLKERYAKAKEENHCKAEERQTEIEAEQESEREAEEREGDAKAKEEGYEKEINKLKTRKELIVIYSESIGWV